MSDSDDDRTQINMRVSKAKKQEWDNALEENETLSSLIRRSVDKEIHDEYVHVNVLDNLESRDTESGGENTEEITNELNELRLTVQTLTNQIQSLQTATPTSDDTDDTDDAESVEDLALSIIDDIPARAHDFSESSHGVADDADDRDLIRTLIKASKQTSERVDGRAERIAALNDKPVPRVREALNYLEHNTTESIKSAILEDGRHWVRL